MAGGMAGELSLTPGSCRSYMGKLILPYKSALSADVQFPFRVILLNPFGEVKKTGEMEK